MKEEAVVTYCRALSTVADEQHESDQSGLLAVGSRINTGTLAYKTRILTTRQGRGTQRFSTGGQTWSFPIVSIPSVIAAVM
jgi:hypothetical protein